MKRILVPELPRIGKAVEIPEEEANHAVQVLRLRSGDLIELMDGKGHQQKAKLKIQSNRILAEYLEPVDSVSESVSPESQLIPVTLEQAVLKGDAMEWVVEKAVELGVSTFIPVLTSRTVVQLERKGHGFFQKRWQKIADQALKQCGRLQRMEVKPPLALEELVVILPSGSVRLWCDEKSSQGNSLYNWLKQQSPKPPYIQILIGPEGGFQEDERTLLNRSQAVPICLGPMVLRAETAAISAISTLGSYLFSLSKKT